MTSESYREGPGAPRVAQGSPQDTKKDPADTEKSPAYGFWLATLTLVLVSHVALLAMLILKNVFENATDITTVLSALFTVVGTYFGIKTSGDTRDKLQGSIDKANETANRALAELSSEAGRRVMGGR